MMNHEAIAHHCCEKLSQQMKDVFQETKEKKAEQKNLHLKKEETRLKANKLRVDPTHSKFNIREAQLNAQATRTTTREIEDEIQRSRRENWRRDSNHKQLLKEIVLEQSKLIRLEVELMRQRPNKGTRTDGQIPALMTEFAKKFSKLKTCVNKLKLMLSRYEISLNDVISEGSEAKLLLTALQCRFQARHSQESRLNEQQRASAITLRVKNHVRRSGTGESQKQTTPASCNEVNREIIKERLVNERETNNQLDSLLNQARNWLLQEEHFKKEVETLQQANQQPNLRMVNAEDPDNLEDVPS